jgi:RNA-directed DNA polymerase
MPRKKSTQAFVRKVKDHLRKASLGLSIWELVQQVNPRLRGWAAYFRIGNSFAAALALQHKVIEQLRLFLRRKHHRKRNRGYRHWPDAFFYAKGLVYVPALVR